MARCTALAALALFGPAAGFDVEWRGSFDTPLASYVWSAEANSQTAVAGVYPYADASMGIVVYPLADSSPGTYFAAETAAQVVAAGTCEAVAAGGTIVASTTKCYTMNFNTAAAISEYTISTGTAAVAFLTQHYPTEFESSQHYFKETSGGVDVEPAFQNPLLPLSPAAPWAVEWKGTFDTPNASYTWSAESNAALLDKGVYPYADASMGIVVYPIVDSTQASYTAVQTAAEALATAGRCIPISDDGTIYASAHTCYTLAFDPASGKNEFTVSTANTAAVAFVTQHYPTEFERTQHYLKETPGAQDVEPVWQDPVLPLPPSAPCVEYKAKNWGDAMGACILVIIVTLTGVIFLAPQLGALQKANPGLFMCALNAFAAGALLAAAFYLMLFEGVHLIYSFAPYSEGAQAGMWGSAVLLGFVTSFIVEFLVFLVMGDKESGKVSDTAGTVGLPRNKQIRVLSGVLLGDFMHNLVDGIIIGVGFSQCGKSFGWSITASTVYHELAQELSDYIVLTDPNQGGLKPVQALVFNFISGLSVMLGAIILLSMDTMENDAKAILLAYGGGVYIQIAAVECMPRMHDTAKTAKTRMLGMFFFLLGAMAIGLVLLDHEHCVPTKCATAVAAAAPAAGGHGH
jgi:zinc transporter ZupT